MPIIDIKISENFISEDSKSKIIKYLSQSMLEAEGLPNTEKARNLTWCFFNEVNKKSWSVGGSECEELKLLIRVSMFRQFINETKKEEIAKRIHNVLKSVLKSEYNSKKSFIIIEEISDNNFCSGGKTIKALDLANLFKINPSTLLNN